VREVLASSVVLAPSDRVVADVLFQAAGTFRLLHRSPSRTVSLGTIRVTGTPPATASSRVAGFFAPAGDEAMARDAAALVARAPARPDYVLALRAQGGMMGGMGGMGGMMDMGGAPSPIEWEEDGHMAMMNAMSTTRTMRWTIRDRASGREGMDIPLEAAVGQVKVIRIVNEPDGEHPMQHPIHLHGQRFLVAARDGVAETNPAWEDTVLVPAGSTYDLLVVFETPGTWLLHCHIPEHMEAGMMAAFQVKDRG
jgi:suppressor of ftsI